MKAHFSLFGIPIRIDSSFPIVIAIFGYFAFLRSGVPHGTEKFFLAFPVVLLAVLAHELGHAGAGRAFGLKPFVILHALGGMTQFPPQPLRALTHGRRILITLAGPAVGVVVGAIALGVFLAGGFTKESLEHEVLGMTVVVTLGWSLVNLAPVLPLDGGHVLATALEKWLGMRGPRMVRIGSIVLALGAGAALFALLADPIWAMIGGILAFVNYRAYRLERFWQEEQPLQKELQAAADALGRGETAEARARIAAVRPKAQSVEAAARVAHLAAWASLLDGDAATAKQHLDALPKGAQPDAYLDGKIRAAIGDASGALGPLTEALEDRREDEVAEAVADAAHASGRIDEVLALLASEERSRTTGAAALERVAFRLHALGSHALAARLYEAVFDRFQDPLDAFNAACARAVDGDPDGALEWLGHALDAGLEETRLMDTDEDLASLRGRPELDALRARARSRHGS